MDAFQFDLNALYLFTQVVEHKGYTAAGHALGIPKSRLSRHVAQLEQQLGVRLLQRTTRRIQLTEIGNELYQLCAVMMLQAEAVKQAALRTLHEPVGTVRCSVASILADEVIAKLLPKFMAQFPKVNIELQATSRRIDLLEEGVDLVIRGLGVTPPPGDLVQRTLGSVQWILVASPSYLTQHGQLQEISQLAEAQCLLYQPLYSQNAWLLYGPEGRQQTLDLHPRLRSDNLRVVRQAALDGQGICGLPRYACKQALESGELHEVLPGWHPQSGEMVILYPSRRGITPAVRALIDFFIRELPPLLTNQREN